MIKKETVTKTDLLKVLDLMEASGIQYWLDGGWGVDVLVGKQTREHRDVDINFDARCTDVLLDTLVSIGYEIVTDWRPVRIELYHPELSYVDIHPFVINDDGTAKQADLEGGWYEFEADYFGSAVFEGRTIPCISAKGQNSGKWISMTSGISTICLLFKPAAGMRQGERYARQKNRGKAVGVFEKKAGIQAAQSV